MTIQESEKLLEETALKLGEHFEAVQILATWQSEGDTLCAKRGCGNFYARTAMAQEFIQEDIAQQNAAQIAEHLNEANE